MADIDELLTTEEAGAVLRRSPKTLEQWRWQKHGPRYVKTGPRTVAYRRSDLQAFIEAQTIDPAA